MGRAGAGQERGCLSATLLCIGWGQAGWGGGTCRSRRCGRTPCPAEAGAKKGICRGEASDEMVKMAWRGGLPCLCASVWVAAGSQAGRVVINPRSLLF